MFTTQLMKDTFYAAIRNRIAANNPARTIVVRGVIRPGVVVAENELPGAAVDGIAPADAFCLRWNALAIDTQSALPLLTLTCEIRYATDGTTSMDRGRALAAMDAELATAISCAPADGRHAYHRGDSGRRIIVRNRHRDQRLLGRCSLQTCGHARRTDGTHGANRGIFLWPIV